MHVFFRSFRLTLFVFRNKKTTAHMNTCFLVSDFGKTFDRSLLEKRVISYVLSRSEHHMGSIKFDVANVIRDSGRPGESSLQRYKQHLSYWRRNSWQVDRLLRPASGTVALSTDVLTVLHTAAERDLSSSRLGQWAQCRWVHCGRLRDLKLALSDRRTSRRTFTQTPYGHRTPVRPTVRDSV